jgi:diamine N-acetyltransferase
MENAKKFTIRRARPEDAELLSEIGARGFYQSFAAENTPDNMAAYLGSSFYPEKQAEELAQPGATFLIMENESDPIGFAHLREDSAPTCITGQRPVELSRIYVLDGWKGQGIGSRLMQACIDEALNRGADVLWLGVWEHNPRAIEFYKRWGFTVVGSHPFLLGDEAQVDFVMQCVLSEKLD